MRSRWAHSGEMRTVLRRRPGLRPACRTPVRACRSTGRAAPISGCRRRLHIRCGRRPAAHQRRGGAPEAGARPARTVINGGWRWCRDGRRRDRRRHGGQRRRWPAVPLQPLEALPALDDHLRGQQRGCDAHSACAGAGAQLTCTCDPGYVASDNGCQPCGTQSCDACNACGQCASGTLDTCSSGVCNASAPSTPGPQPCQACGLCGCAWGTTDECGNGCNAIPPPKLVRRARSATAAAIATGASPTRAAPAATPSRRPTGARSRATRATVAATAKKARLTTAATAATPSRRTSRCATESGRRRNRTFNKRIKSPLLYQLSYAPGYFVLSGPARPR